MAEIYLSTIDENAHILAKSKGFGLEIAQFCTAWNMDARFSETDEAVQKEIAGVTKKLLHAPFNELFPCAIDPEARALASRRYRQAIALAKNYGASKVVIHGGYNPRIYYPVWYVEQSILFWKDFLTEDPGVEIVLENVLEETPELLLDIVQGVDDPRLRLCLDVGHANAYSGIPALQWLERSAPWLSHFHIHNNDGSWDTHSQLFEGTIPMEDILESIGARCPDASVTLELMDAAPSVAWLEAFQWKKSSSKR